MYGMEKPWTEQDIIRDMAKIIAGLKALGIDFEEESLIDNTAEFISLTKDTK